MKDTCSKCGDKLEENRQGKQRYCKKCHNEYMNNTRPKHSELSDIERLKANARSYLNAYIRRGKIVKQPCCICGNPIAQAHHSDYSKPLDVEWYCLEHHIDLHKNVPRVTFS